jgi:hypothetical protein
VKFVAHEVEQTTATGVALVIALSLAALSFLCDKFLGSVPFGLFVPVVLGVAGIVASPLLLQRLRPASTEYTKGDWASLILLEVFGWLGIWFVLTDLFLH